MSTRYDRGSVNKVERSQEGFITLKGYATRTGVFKYRNADGSERLELRHPDDVLDPDSLMTLAGKPFTLEHPPELVTPRNASRYQKGSINNRVVEVGDGLIEVVVNVHHEDAIDDIDSRRRQELSCGYNCDVQEESGTYKGERYTHRQRNIRYNHLALVQKGRAGSVCGLHLDSDRSDDVAVMVFDADDISTGNTEGSPLTPVEKRMATLHLDGANYEVPESLAAVFGPKVKEIETLRTRVDSVEKELQAKTEEAETLEGNVDELTDERDRERGRADALEIQIEELKYQLEDSGDRTDSEDEDTVSISEEEIEARIKAGIEAGLAARKDAEDLLDNHGIDLSTVKFDSAFSPLEINKVVVQQLRPKVNLDGKDAAFVDGILASLKDDSTTTRNDAPDFTEGSMEAIAGARKSSTKKGDEGAPKKSANCKKPLSMSKRAAA